MRIKMLKKLFICSPLSMKMTKGKYKYTTNILRIQQEDSDANDFGSDILVEENTALAEEYEKTASVIILMNND